MDSVVIGGWSDMGALLTEARAAAESRMVDSCSVVRPAVRPASGGQLNADGLPIVASGGDPVPVYAGKGFLLEKRLSNPNPREVGGDFPVIEVLTWKVPSLAPALNVGDLITLTACPDHPRDVGLVLRVSSINPGTQKKEQSVQVEVVVG